MSNATVAFSTSRAFGPGIENLGNWSTALNYHLLLKWRYCKTISKISPVTKSKLNVAGLLKSVLSYSAILLNSLNLGHRFATCYDITNSKKSEEIIIT